MGIYVRAYTVTRHCLQRKQVKCQLLKRVVRMNHAKHEATTTAQVTQRIYRALVDFQDLRSVPKKAKS